MRDLGIVFVHLIAALARWRGINFSSPIAEAFHSALSEEVLKQHQVQVLQHVATGRRNREIGAKLFIAQEMVKAHRKHIMDKLNAKDRTRW